MMKYWACHVSSDRVLLVSTHLWDKLTRNEEDTKINLFNIITFQSIKNRVQTYLSAQ